MPTNNTRAIQAFRRTVVVDWPAQAPAQAKALLVKTAQDGHAKIMADQTARGGFAPQFEFYVNRPGNTNFASLILPGPIVYRYRYFQELIVAALEALRKASPVVSGLYRDSHTLYIDGKPAAGVPPNIGPNDEIIISNPVPYARRLEVGKTESGRDFVVQVEPRIYQRVVENVLLPRFRNVARIRFNYVSIPNAYVVKGKLPSTYIAKGGVRRRRRQAIGSRVRAPAIIISGF